MKGISTELLYGLGVAAIVLFQYLRRHFQQRSEPQAEAVVETPSRNAEPALETTSAGSTLVDRESTARQAARTRSLIPSAEERSAYRSLLRNKRAVRKAMVNATILGPCRAFDPPS